MFFLIFVLLSFLSTFYNAYLGRVDFLTSFLFSLRNIEYLLYVVLGFLLAKYNFNFSRILLIYLGYIVVLIVLQSSNLVPAFSDFTTDRAIANTGGPWELAAISAFLLLYFFENFKLLAIMASLVILVLTMSRITTLASLIVVFIYYRHIILAKIYSNKQMAIFAFLSFISFILVFLIFWLDSYQVTFQFSLLSRFNGLFTTDSILNVLDLLIRRPVVEDYQAYKEYLESFVINTQFDQSAYVRFSNWGVLLSSMSDSLDSIFVGLGPSFAGKAVDGHYVRFLIETGFLGLFIFIVFVIVFYVSVADRLLKSYLLVLLITATFIDIFTTYKAMMIFWVFYGKYLYEFHKRRL